MKLRIQSVPFILGFSLLGLASCSGEIQYASVAKYQADGGMNIQGGSELGGSQKADAQAQADTESLPVSFTEPDSGPPLTVPVLPMPGVGEACPCAAPLICLMDACRVPCDQPTDACQAKSNCASNERCFPVSNSPAGFYCVPAAAKAGEACDGTNVRCGNGYVCAYVYQGAAPANPKQQCLPTCEVEAAKCGSLGNGSCFKHSSGCMFCSTP
jgi:hypothetical protein